MTDLLRNWETACGKVRAQIGETAYQTWIYPLKATCPDAANLHLEAPDIFFKEWVENHYRRFIEESLREVAPEVAVDIHLVAAAPSAQAAPVGPAFVPAPDRRESSSSLQLNPRYTFENFVVGSSNRHAHAYCMAVAESPAKTYNPLFIYGGVGLGKTHLIQAICHHIDRTTSRGQRIHYVSSERFTNELIDAIQRHSTAAFRQKYRSVDVLVIDDIHFIAGKESTQEEFFHTFNALYDAHKQIVFCSDRPPKEIANLQERLVSRFGWGLTTDIQPPDFETRVAILQKKIEREPVSVPADVIQFIAGLIKTNIRELEGALIRTIAYSLLEEKPITLGLAQEVLRDLLKEPQKLITVDFIQRCVAEEFGLSLTDFKAKRRNRTVVLPRQMAMYLSRELTDLSLPEIGNCFGGRDHTTVLHSYNRVKEEMLKNPQVKERVERLINLIQQ